MLTTTDTLHSVDELQTRTSHMSRTELIAETDTTTRIHLMSTCSTGSDRYTKRIRAFTVAIIATFIPHFTFTHDSHFAVRTSDAVDVMVVNPCWFCHSL